ncbi:MAG: hypothetical protein AVDCRST_MAG05-4184, partial [uncultured Rubrobacteraceae bacterium]
AQRAFPRRAASPADPDLDGDAPAAGELPRAHGGVAHDPQSPGTLGFVPVFV